MSSPFNNPAGRAPEQANAYVRSILELLGDRDPMSELPKLAPSLRAAVAGVDAAALQKPEMPGKWSMHDVVAHLADSEIVWGWRLRLVVAEDRPVITGYDQDAWTARAGAAYPDVASAIGIIESLRASHVALLRSLDPAQWERVGVHNERGPESVRLMSKLYAGHDLVHLRQIARVRAAVMA
jgi:hypothetical protein